GFERDGHARDAPVGADPPAVLLQRGRAAGPRSRHGRSARAEADDDVVLLGVGERILHGHLPRTACRPPHPTAVCRVTDPPTGTRRTVTSTDARPTAFPRTPARTPVRVLDDHDRSHRDFLYPDYSHPSPEAARLLRRIGDEHVRTLHDVNEEAREERRARVA